ncbi:MAG: hypothetical protein PUK59_06430 [Actinomycetaceae bacterium]|nr:hypothetical protein [Actinomycetaceae bacterium]MDY5855072.1 hypothetical protein [Arcanobacterium sp.]
MDTSQLDSQPALRPGLDDVPEFSQQEELMSFPVPEKAVLASAVHLPVAHVLVDAPGAQWNPFYEYEIPQKLDRQVVVGCRVRVPFGALRVEGFVIGRSSEATQGRQLRMLDSVVSPLPVLSQPIFQLCQRIARRQAAPVIDVIRLAVPTRHARAEREVSALAAPVFPSSASPDPGLWELYEDGAQVIADMSAGLRVRGGCILAPAHSDSAMLAPAVQAVLAAGKSALIVVPTPKAADRLAAELRAALVGEPLGVFTAQLPHAQRYQMFVSILEGRVRVVIGTRSAAYAPLPNVGLIVGIDVEHPAQRERRSPYIDTMQVLRERADIDKTSLLVFSRSASLDLAQLEHSQWARPRITIASRYRRALMPHIVFAQDVAYEGAPWARLPDSVFSTIRSSLTLGNVLITVPRSGYIPSIACARCGKRAQCPQCGGELAIMEPDAPPICERCGWRTSRFVCAYCGFRKLRPIRIGSVRTAQEIGRAFSGVSIITAREEREQISTPRRHAIVVATPGQIPIFEQPYAAAVIIDAGSVLHTSGLDAPLNFFHIWAKVAGSVLPREAGGTVLIVGAIEDDIAATVREGSWLGWEQEAYREREALALPPTAAWISLEGKWEDVREFLAAMRGIAAREMSADPAEHSPQMAVMSDETPLDALLAGGVHQLLPHAAVLGPTRRPDGTTLTYVRCSEENRPWCTRIVRLARSELALKGTRGSRVTVTVDPQL